MLDLAVASGALDVVPGHVEIMDEWGVGVLFELLRLVVTGVAALPWGLPVPLDHIEVALLTCDPRLYQRVVVEGEGSHLDVSLRRSMAKGTAAERMKLTRGFFPLEVTEEASGVGDLDVTSHHDLRVAACPSEL